MHRIIVLGSGWLGTSAAEAGREAGMTVEPIRRSDSPELFPPTPSALLRLRARATGARAVVNACGVLRGSEEQLDEANHRLARFVAMAVASTGATLVHIGSAAEYGPPVSELIREDDAVAPQEAYGCSKLAGTSAVLDECSPCEVVVARVFNPVGPGQPEHLPVSEFARSALSGDTEPLVIRNAATERDFVSVHDVGRALVSLAMAQTIHHPIVNVCSGVGLRYGEIAQAMLDRLDSDRSIRSLDEPVIPSVVGDPTRLRETTGVSLPASAGMVAELALAAAAGGLSSTDYRR